MNNYAFFSFLLFTTTSFLIGCPDPKTCNRINKKQSQYRFKKNEKTTKHLGLAATAGPTKRIPHPLIIIAISKKAKK